MTNILVDDVFATSRPGSQKKATMPELAVEYRRAELPMKMAGAAEEYERRFSLRFETVLHFPRRMLDELHRSAPDAIETSPNVIVASQNDPTIVQDIGVLHRVATSVAPTRTDREEYLAALLRVYTKLPAHPGLSRGGASVLRIGIQREGRLLGEKLGWLPPSSALPHVKRIPFDGGLLIGVGQFEPMNAAAHAIIVDGAIASGSTAMAIIQLARCVTSSFRLFSVHATLEGLVAIERFVERLGVAVTLTVGHATRGLNSHYYAVDEKDDVIVGDLGDTISDLEG